VTVLLVHSLAESL